MSTKKMKPSKLRMLNRNAEAQMRAIDFYNLGIKGNPYPEDDLRHNKFNYARINYIYWTEDSPDGINRYGMTLEEEPIVANDLLHLKDYHMRLNG